MTTSPVAMTFAEVVALIDLPRQAKFRIDWKPRATRARPMRPLAPQMMTLTGLTLSPSRGLAASSSSCARLASASGTSGSRYVSSISPIIAIAALTGTGLVSMNKILEQREEFRVDAARALEIAFQRGVRHFRHLARDDIGDNADHADGADAHHRQRQGVVSRQNAEFAVDHPAQLADAIDHAGGFLEPDDILRQIAAQARDRVVRDVHAATPRDVVENERNLGGFGDGAEVRVQSRLGRLVVIRRHLQRRIGPNLFRVLGHENRFVGRVRARTRDDFAPFGGELAPPVR